MPTYIYKCDKCNNTFKAFHGMNDTLTECLDCHEVGHTHKIPTLLTSLPERDKQQTAAGTRVKEAIEDNRQLLLDSKQEHLSKKL
jgi:putative FmdB family regulatory protein